MREILFRGKRKDNGEWVYGHYHNCDYVGYPNGGDNKTTRHYILPQNAGDAHVVIPETVGQYTGLTDKNGKRIFEGDIIENIDGRAIVFFDKTPCGFYMRFLDAYEDTPLDMGEMWDETEVIGNEHDNPELLEVVQWLI